MITKGVKNWLLVPVVVLSILVGMYFISGVWYNFGNYFFHMTHGSSVTWENVTVTYNTKMIYEIKNKTLSVRYWTLDPKGAVFISKTTKTPYETIVKNLQSASEYEVIGIKKELFNNLESVFVKVRIIDKGDIIVRHELVNSQHAIGYAGPPENYKYFESTINSIKLGDIEK